MTDASMASGPVLSGPVATLIASGGAAWEPALLSRLNGRPELRVVRRCVDLVDLLATAAAGTGRVALVGAGLHRLDRDVLARLRAAGVGVVGVAAASDGVGRDRLVALGVGVVLEAESDAAAIAEAVSAAARALRPGPRSAAPTTELLAAPYDDADTPATPGLLVAVWGPTGAPGRTTVAVNLAAELAACGLETLLADADTYGASVAQSLGLLDEAPGLAAAVRTAAQGALDPSSLARHARQVSPRLRVLSGLPRAARWPELRPAALANVWDVARQLAAAVVVDCGFSLEQDEELAFDVAAPRRNAATLTTIEKAGLVVVVGGADPVSLQRLVRGLGELHEAVPGAATSVLVNRVRRGVGGSDGARAPVRVLRRHAGVEEALLLPDNASAVDAAMMAGRPLLDVVPRAPLRLAIKQLSDQIAADLRPAPAPSPRARHRARVASQR